MQLCCQVGHAHVLNLPPTLGPSHVLRALPPSSSLHTHTRHTLHTHTSALVIPLIFESHVHRQTLSLSLHCRFLLAVDDASFVREVKFYGLTLEMLGEGRLLIVGGEDDDGPYDVCSTFSPFTLAWESACAVPVSVDAHGCAALDGVPYVCGGYDENGKKLRVAHRYVAASKRWERVGDLNVPRARHQLVAIGGLLYAVGGLMSKQGVENHGLAVIERFCPSTNRWTVLPTRIAPRYGFAACAAGNFIYLVGGLSEDGTRVAEVDRYNVLSGECDKMPDLPTPRAYLSAVVYEGQLYAIGGNNAANAPVTTVEILAVGVGAGSHRQRSWAPGPSLPTPRCDAAAVVLNGIIYMCGGEDDESYLCTVDILDPSSESWTHGPHMDVAKSSLAACVLPF
jgi:N-acetylneuraminic acid mutarotase